MRTEKIPKKWLFEKDGYKYGLKLLKGGLETVILKELTIGGEKKEAIAAEVMNYDGVFTYLLKERVDELLAAIERAIRKEEQKND
jgi:hypothetical protein